MLYKNSGFPDGMTRDQATICFVMGTLEELKRNGHLQGGKYKPAKKMLQAYKKLLAMNFQPSDEEMAAVICVLADESGGVEII